MIPATDGQKGGLGEEGAGLKGKYQLSWDVDSEVSSLACYVMGEGGRREGGAVLETTRASEEPPRAFCRQGAGSVIGVSGWAFYN